jgi:hypothetical protein
MPLFPREFVQCPVPVLSARKPWQFLGFSHFWPILRGLPCLSACSRSAPATSPSAVATALHPPLPCPIGLPRFLSCLHGSEAALDYRDLRKPVPTGLAYLRKAGDWTHLDQSLHLKWSHRVMKRPPSGFCITPCSLLLCSGLPVRAQAPKDNHRLFTRRDDRARADAVHEHGTADL